MTARYRKIAGALTVTAFVLAHGAAPARADRTTQPASADLHARGQLLAIAPPFAIFTTGDALRLRAGTAIPRGATIGSTVLVTIARAEREIYEISLVARASDEIDISRVPREDVAVARASARTIDAAPVASARTTGDAASVTLAVTVPANTPPSDDVYVSTDRSNFSPAEVRMQRIDARRFIATVPLGPTGKLRYQYTRGSYATVERDRSGGIVEPHVVDSPQRSNADTVTRWADTN